MNTLKKSFLVVLVAVSLFFSFLLVGSNDVFASGVLEVDRVASKTEKLKEKITLLLKFDKSKKADYYKYLTEKRLAELIYVVKSENIDLVEETASRYATYIGQLTNFIRENKLSSKKNDLNEMYNDHTLRISEIQKKFKYDSGWWLAIQHDLNTILILKDQIRGI